MEKGERERLGKESKLVKNNEEDLDRTTEREREREKEERLSKQKWKKIRPCKWFEAIYTFLYSFFLGYHSIFLQATLSRISFDILLLLRSDY